MTVDMHDDHACGGLAPELPARNLTEAFLATVARRGDAVAISDPARDVELTWNELRRRVGAAAAGLAKLGVGKGDTVALLHSNRHELYIADLAAVSLGAVPFSVYPTYAAEQIAHQLADAGAKVAIVEAAFLERLAQGRAQMPALQTIVTFDGDGGDLRFDELSGDFDLSAAAVEPDDLLTLIYTSGTTGAPKGVQLTHRNLLLMLAGVRTVLPIPADAGRVISWLPAAHIAERAAHYYLPVIFGVSVTICPDPRLIAEFLPEVRPVWFFAVPRIWEKLKAGIETQFATLPEAAQRGLDAAIRKVRLEQAGEPVPLELQAAVSAADEQLFSELRARLGLDAAVALNVGAAPTDVAVLEFFHAIGLPVGELWGMSEACGVVTMNPPGRAKLGTVGPPLPGFEVRVAGDGEVLTRGSGIMAGYRNLPDKTAETIDADGWLATGDIGELDADGYLRIVDRKKELIISAAGKNMSPAEIEGKLKAASPLIAHAVAIGDRRPYNVALIVLEPGADAGEDEIAAAVERANQRLARVEQIKRFAIVEDDWQPGGHELTPTMKLKRKPIAEKYTAQIEALYET